MYSFPDLEPVCCSMSSSNCCFLTCIQISQEAVQVDWYSHLLKNFPQFVVTHTVKGFGVVNKAEIDVFLEYFFYDPTNVGDLISGSSVFSKTILNIWKFTVHILLKPGLENFEHYFTSTWDECNCAVVWKFFKSWEYQTTWPASWEICMQVKKQQLELDMEEQNWFQIGKGVCQGCICHPAYLTYMQSTSWETLGWMKHKLVSRLLGEISITSDMQMTPPLWQKVKRN